MLRRPNRAIALLALLPLAAACVPRAQPLPGAPVPAGRVPRAELPTDRQRVVFRWSYEESDLSARGDGVARLSPPDSARLDLFIGGGFGGGAAALVGNELRLPDGAEGIRRFLPPPPMLWAALGRLAVPAARDTVARVDADTLRADIGRQPVWRATFVGERLTRLERIEDGHVLAWVARDGDARIRYRDEREGRSLTLNVERRENASEFDPQIWHP